jgi:Trk K+ transport system NAD-binding subunit
MNFIVVGCGRGRVGAELSHHLFKHGHQVVAVDSNKEAVYDPPPSLNGPSEYM